MLEFDWEAIGKAWPFLCDGMLLNFKITVVAVIVGILLGMVLALLRLANLPLLSSLATGYTNFFRSVPLMMVLLWFFLIIPGLIKQWLHMPHAFEMQLPLAMLGFGLFEAAYYAEIIRAGIQGIHSNQIQAAYALGLNYTQTMRWVILPQAFRNMIPLFLTQAIILFQDTSLVYVGSLADFLRNAKNQAEIQNRHVELYLFAATVYFILCSTASFTVGYLQVYLGKGKRNL